MAVTNVAEAPAVAFIAGKRTVPSLKSLKLATLDGYDALCSYGPHFPVLVALSDDTIAHNPAGFDGDAYANAHAESGFGGNYRRARRLPSESPTTRRHVNGALWALRRSGFRKAGRTTKFAGYTLDIWVRIK